MPKLAFRLALLLTTLAGGANTCFVSVAHAQDSTTDSVVHMSADSVLTFGQLASDYGITFCEGPQAYSFIQLGLDSMVRRQVEVHEAKHREQFTRFRSCEEFKAWYKTPVGKLDSETEAYVAGWCEAKRQHYDDLEGLERSHLMILYQMMGGGTPVYEILKRWKHYATC